MSAPESSCTNTIKSKYSPFCSSGINKSLLTPCRQVGLSRKRKTSFNKSVKSSENLNTNVNNLCINDYSANKTTPLTHNNNPSGKRKKLFLNVPITNQDSSIDSGLKNIEDNEALQKNCDIQLYKKDLLETFILEDLFNSSDQFCSVKDGIEDNKKKLPDVMHNTHQISNVESIKNERSNKQNISNDNNESCGKVNKRRLSNDYFINFENVHKKNEKSFSQTSMSDSSDDDFVISKIKQENTEVKSNSAKKAYTKKPLHYVTDNSFESDHLKDASCTKPCKIRLQKLSEEEIKSNNCIDNDMTSNKKYKSNSSEDADFFTSTPEEEIIKRKNLEKNMTALEKQIKQKQSILENLERASIYKNKHNIPELKQLTSLWLDGCVKASRDLLAHLQAHGPIDQTTLLNNMQIPKEIIAKLQL